MSHKRKDTLAKVKEWAKHLRRRGKRTQAHRERRAADREIARQRNTLTAPDSGI